MKKMLKVAAIFMSAAFVMLVLACPQNEPTPSPEPTPTPGPTPSLTPFTLSVDVPTAKRNTALELTVNLTTEGQVKRVLYKEGTHDKYTMLGASSGATAATATSDNKKWTFTVSKNAKFTVVAEDDLERSAITEVEVTCFDYAAPGTVTNLEATYNETDKKIVVTWENPIDEDFANLKISWKKDSESYSEPLELSKESVAYTISSIDESANSYTIKIQTCDTLGNINGGSTNQVAISGGTITPTIPEGFVLLETKNASFQMGSTDSNAYDNEKPVHYVTFTKNLLVCDHEVTQAEYEKYCKYSSSTPSATYGKGDNFPAYYVAWYDAIVYCNLRSIAEGLTPCYKLGTETDPKKWEGIQKDNETNPQKYCGPKDKNDSWNGITCDFTADGYRLLTEAEWEYAARGGIADTDKDVWAGTSDSAKLESYAWFDSNSSKKTHEVKGMTANGYSLYDMSGNVFEWCWDRYGNYENKDANDPVGAVSGSDRVRRGGCWGFDASKCRASFRNNYSPESRSDYLGFRLARTVQQQ